MEISIINILLVPEISLTIFSLICLLYGLFSKKNVFRKTSNLSIFILIYTIFLVYFDNTTDFAYYNKLINSSNFINYFKILVLIGAASSIIISKDYLIEKKLSKFEIPVLFLFSTLGMLLIISCNNLMLMYLAIELQSLSLYVVAAIKRDSLYSAESGVKYFILGALSSGILLYGLSLIYGFTGTTNFKDISFFLSQSENLNLGLIFGLVFVLVGIAFKISAVPFHMWTPDVYEGAPTPITAFFAIVPKISSVALIFRFCLEPFGNFYSDWSLIVIFLSIASMFLGAIAAISQSNIKRLLAYSSIGHIGYVLISLVAFNQDGIKAASIYMFIYMIMNIGIFSILLSLKTSHGYIEKISELSGLSKSNPLTSLSIAIIMLSMAGLPPFIGFFGKFYVFISALNNDLYILAILGVLASVISAYYYLRIIKVMYFDNVIDKKYQSLSISIQSRVILIVVILIITLFVFYPSLLLNFSPTLFIS